MTYHRLVIPACRLRQKGVSWLPCPDTAPTGHESFYLHDADRTVDYAQQSLTTLNPAYTRIVALTTVELGRAYTLSGEVGEATRLFGDAGEIAARNSSVRLIETIRRGRAELQPFQGASAVRELDDRLATYGLA